MSLSEKGKIIRKKVALILYDCSNFVCAYACVCVCWGVYGHQKGACMCVCVCMCVCWGVYGHQKVQKKHVTPRGLADQRLRLRLCNTRIYEMMGVN